MPWMHRTKTIGIKQQTPHIIQTPGVVGTALKSASTLFTPLELFGSAARTSYTSVVNPAVVSPESEMMRTLLEQHVDDVSADFAVMASAHAFKDFVGTYFTGAVAAGIAYLAMVRSGYTWVDHFESLLPKLPKARYPDFVFTGHGLGTAFMEAKGTRRASYKDFDKKVEGGYRGQVEPHLGKQLRTIKATHGFCIGAYLSSATKGELIVHHTDVPAATLANPTTAPVRTFDPTISTAVQRGNYARAFLLAHGQQLSSSIRDGAEVESIRFVRFKWRGRSWLTRPLGFRGDLHFIDIYPFESELFFAVEEGIAERVLVTFLGATPGKESPLDVEPIGMESPRDIEAISPGEEEGAVFPDGLAVMRRTAIDLDAETVIWTRWSGFSPA